MAHHLARASLGAGSHGHRSTAALRNCSLQSGPRWFVGYGRCGPPVLRRSADRLRKGSGTEHGFALRITSQLGLEPSRASEVRRAVAALAQRTAGYGLPNPPLKRAAVGGGLALR